MDEKLLEKSYYKNTTESLALLPGTGFFPRVFSYTHEHNFYPGASPPRPEISWAFLKIRGNKCFPLVHISAISLSLICSLNLTHPPVDGVLSHSSINPLSMSLFTVRVLL